MEDSHPDQVGISQTPASHMQQNGAPEPDRPTETPTPTPAPTSPPDTDPPQAPEPYALTTNVGWQYNAESPVVSMTRQQPEEISWTASEFIAHEKSAGWYGLLALVGIVAAALVVLITKDVVSMIVIVLAMGSFGIYAARKPRTQQFHLSPRGLQIGEKLYGFQDFKTFSVAEDGSIVSVTFMPLKRFSPPLTIYVSQDIEEQVLDYLGDFLPSEQHRVDVVDSLMRRIRF